MGGQVGSLSSCFIKKNRNVIEMSTHILYGCHQCSVALFYNAFSRNMCDRYDKCRLACNVCGGITIVLYGRSCDLCILSRSLFVDLSGSPGYCVVLAVSWILPSSCQDYQRSICLSAVLAASAVFTSQNCLTQRSTGNYCCCKLSEPSHID